MKFGRMSRKGANLSLFLLAFGLCLFNAAAQAADAPKKITFVAGTVGGAWYNSAAVMAQAIMSDVKDLHVTATSGLSLGNIRLINEGEDAQMGWTYLASVFQAQQGIKPFKKKLTNVRVVLPGMLGSPYFVCNKKSGVKDWGDLKSKRVITSQLGGQNENLTRKVFALYGFNYDDIKKNGGSVNHVKFTQAVTLMKDNRADCALAPAPPNNPLGLVLDLENSMDLVIPPIRKDIIAKFVAQNRGYMGYPLSPMYKSLKNVSPPVEVIAGTGVIITNKDLPDDFVYNVTKAILKNRQKLYEVNKMYTYMKDPKHLTLGIDPSLFHPGALKAIKEFQ
jgi:TRAP transporter TAXI family solute receptor